MNAQMHKAVEQLKLVANTYVEAIEDIYSQKVVRPIEIPEDVKSKLYYKDIEVHANEDDIFFFVKDGKAIYFGQADEEGLEQTIINDINSTPTFINGLCVIMMDDTEGIEHIFKATEDFITFMDEMVKGYRKGQENGHY